MMQKTPSIVEIPPEGDEPVEGDAAPPVLISENVATVWVSRASFIVGGLCLFMALSVWLWRPNHYRLVLAFLTIAMFSAIVHSYTFENGQD